MKESNLDNELDRLLNERFREYKIEPSAKAWDNLDVYVTNTLAKRKKRRAAWFWFLSLLLLLTIGKGIYEWTKRSPNILNSNKNVSQIKSKQNRLNETNDPINININSNNKPKENSSDEETLAGHTSINTIDDIGDKQHQKLQKGNSKNISIENNLVAEKKNRGQIQEIENDSEQKTKIITKKDKNKINRKISTKPDLNISIENQVNKNPDTEQNTFNSTSITKNRNNNIKGKTVKEKSSNDLSNNQVKKGSDTEQKITGKITKDEKIAEENTFNISANKQTKINSDSELKNLTAEIETKKEENKTENRISEEEASNLAIKNQVKKDSAAWDKRITNNLLSDSALVNKDSILKTDSVIANKVIKPAEAKEIKATALNRFSVLVSFSPEYVNRMLKNNNSDGETAEYYNKKEKLTQPTYTTQLKIGYNITDRWQIQLGLGYNYFSQKSMLISDTLGNIQDNTTTSTITTSSGSIKISCSSFGPLHPYHPEKTRLSYRTSEKYEYLTIPVSVQYRLNEGKTTLKVLAGLAVNVLVKSTLKLDINSENTVAFNHIDGLQKTNFSFLVGIGMERDLWKRFYISLMPMINGSFTPINKGTSVKSYPYFIGLQIGLGYKF
ncbi:MAG: outer membrane beta-barrel protein [Bacteroidetes bacterium]|nr:outer membrane beta-barrel protein [Bacteroidota bacterium]